MSKKEKKRGLPKGVKAVITILVCFIAAFILVAAGYVTYVFTAYNRVGDMTLTPENVASGTLATGKEYKLVSYNIGFGAYEDDYGFFMDGGTEGQAWSEERLDKNMKNIADLLKEENADIYFIQEVDIDSTRSYHLDERTYLTGALADKSYVFAQNWNSPFLFYPFTKPHGAAKTGIMIFAKATLKDAERVELPVETGVMKIVDLDRCYEKTKIDLEGGKQLVLFNFHLSAYTSDGLIANEQLKLLLEDFDKEYRAGNYCIAGGDFNKDLLGYSSEYFGVSGEDFTWAKPIPKDIIDASTATLVAPIDKDSPVPSCRNADGPYNPDQFVLTIDGFLVSPNVTVTSSAVIDTSFKYSDHNPVRMTFVLQP